MGASSEEGERNNPIVSRRSVFKLGAMAAGASGVMFASGQSAQLPISAFAAPSSSGGSALDAWLRNKKATIGVDVTFPPLVFREPSTNKLTGYLGELNDKMMGDLGVTPEYVDTPFAQLVAGLAAGKFDMIIGEVAIVPSRAVRVLFAGFPTFYESAVLLLKPGSTVSKQEQLNASGIKIAVQLGGTSQYSGAILFPKAQLLPSEHVTDQISEVATGRADAAFVSQFDVPDAFKTHPNLKIIPTPVFVDDNTYVMRLGDYKLWHWVTNWLRYQATHNVLSGLWDKWVGTEVRTKYHIESFSVGPSGGPV